MCVVSMITDHYRDKWREYEPFTTPYPYPTKTGPTSEEFEQLKKEVQDLKELLKKAKAYDERYNEPDCEKADVEEAIKKIADFVGVKLDD